ncbi:MAG: hypothetical protein M9894_18015 [Planctomycetes bacterium]|nr:hypothetical protein [Planctomycetota bacterium]
MVRPVCRWSLLFLLLLAPALAQDEGRPERAPRRQAAPQREVRFDPAPEGWRKVEQGGRRRFLLEYALPPAEGQAEGPQVTVMAMGQREFGDYRGRLKGGWSRPDGAPLGDADQVVELRRAADPEVRLVEQQGTHGPRDGARRDGMKLVAAYVRQGDDRWSVWLMGTIEGVDRHREAFLRWVETARPADAQDAPPPHDAPMGPF